MRNLLERLRRRLMEPTGFTVEWMTGGFRFTPPMWTWLVLIGLELFYRLVLG